MKGEARKERKNRIRELRRKASRRRAKLLSAILRTGHNKAKNTGKVAARLKRHGFAVGSSAPQPMGTREERKNERLRKAVRRGGNDVSAKL
jgi:hypothetical protein